ncbi:MAG: NAD(P)-dependent glycerol-3-phosphate dehydrogenase [bacterium]|nr:MAG: NAD(P)-dependent glycerol-3-phosphate dehydrogenase [bacterium]
MAERNLRVGIVGGGSWGTALAIHCASVGLSVGLWVYEEDLARRMADSRENDVYLPGFALPGSIEPTHSLEECLAGTGMVMSVAPSHVTRDVWKEAHSFLPVDAVLVNATKGIEEGTFLTSSGVLAESIGGNIGERMVTLSGPTFAREVAQGLPAAAVIAGNPEVAQQVQLTLNSESFRFYTNQDPVGVEIASSLKNVMAIAVGICDGLQLGHNARAALITRGLAEMARLGVALGADPMTFQGLAGVGDLVLTCTGDLSRNRTLGMRIGRGESLSSITASTPMVAEGVRTTRSAVGLARREGVEMPITEEIHKVLFDKGDPMEALRSLMSRSPKEENVEYAL